MSLIAETKQGAGRVRGGAQVAARDPREERGGDAEHSEHQLGADPEGEDLFTLP